MMLIGVIGLPISFITVLMIVAHSYGTNTSDPVGFITVVLGPPILLATGFGLLRRWRWAWVGTLCVLAFLIVSECWHLLRGPTETRIFVDSAGVPTTVMGSGTDFTALPIALLCTGILVKLISRSVRDEFRLEMPSGRGFFPSSMLHPTWRVGHRGRDMMYYEEKIGGKWEHLDISGEMLMGRAHHVIYFASAGRWQTYPEWVRHRRAEIMARIKSEFRAPDYEYQGDA